MTFGLPRTLLLLASLLLCVLDAPHAQAQFGANVAPEATYIAASEMAAQGRSWSYFSSGSYFSYWTPKYAPEDTIRFGDPVSLAFVGLDSKAVYAIDLIFLSDSGARACSISASDRIIETNLPLPSHKVLHRRYRIPTEAYSDGKLAVSIKMLSGPNAILSGFTLYSSQPGQVSAGTVPTPVPPDPIIPRYTPRPADVLGAKTLQVDLAGVWNFKPSPESPSWKSIQVPGEWAQQGFHVAPNTPATYIRSFHAPATWSHLNVKFKCDAAFNKATVLINGKQAGQHLGGFTPFELDVTHLLHPGQQNSIQMSVEASSRLDTVSHSMNYAGRDLGGIIRKIYLFDVPRTNLADVYLTTVFDSEFRNATLHAEIGIANDGDKQCAPSSLALALHDPSGHPVVISAPDIPIPAIPAGQTKTVTLSIGVQSPKQWDPEHPNLYHLICSLRSGARLTETVIRPLGFRQVDVRGNRLFLNNRAIKIRGIARHEIDPLRGRSLAPGAWERDVKLFRDANVNSVRTSHYPPPEEFIDACNRLGMFVEEEAPVINACPSDPRQASLFVQPMMEAVMRDRSEPSVIMWSLGNESAWGSSFERSANTSRKLDSSRPFVCEGDDAMPPLVPIAAPHYPPLTAPAKLNDNPDPILYGEYVHLTCYNREELYTDPGLRDLWAEGFSKMWEGIMRSQATLGGNIWAGIDEVVFEPDGNAVGYGPWGIIDGWRRPKPEYFYVKKVYSPIRVTTESNPIAPSNVYRLHVENRSEFSNLSELGFHWTLGSKSGWAKVSAPPHGMAILCINAGQLAHGVLDLDIISQRGFVMDRYDFPIGSPTEPRPTAGAISMTRPPNRITIVTGRSTWTIDARTGMILSAGLNGVTVVSSGPHLMLIPRNLGAGCSVSSGPEPSLAPLNLECSGWTATSVNASQSIDSISVDIAGSYKEASGSFHMVFDNSGGVAIDYSFTPKSNIDIWQMGLAFALPPSFDTLTWSTDIGRPQGVAKARNGRLDVGPFGPRRPVSWPWSEDESPLGSNDFRSSKSHIRSASLTDAAGNGLQIESDGAQSIRSWIENDHMKLFAIDYTSEASAHFDGLYPDRVPRPAAAVAGRVVLRMAPLPQAGLSARNGW